MLLLHIETATPTCSVALSENDVLLAVKEKSGPGIHAGSITLLIEEVFEKTGKSPVRLDAVSVSEGPGSYTGLRIGVSTAKGICYALEKPLIAVSTLEAMAYGLDRERAGYGDAVLCPMIDARRMEVYTAVYDIKLQELSPAEARVIDRHTFEELLDRKKVLFFGTGAGKCEPLYAHLENALFPPFSCSAAHLIRPASQKYRMGRFEDTAYFEPAYLKDFQPGIAKNRS